MNITEFGEIITGELIVTLGCGYSVTANPVKKNNGVTLMGITIRDNANNVAPVIYIDKYYKNYSEGTTDISDVISEIMETYNTSRPLPESFSIENFMNWDKAKEHIGCRLINVANNSDLLEDLPYKAFLDLAIVFQYVVNTEDEGYSVLIHKNHMKAWNVTEDDLYAAAMPLILSEVQITPMASILAKMMGGENEITDAIEESENQMYVMGSKSGFNGATGILCTEALAKHAAKQDDDVIILPSSIHEVILLNASSCDCIADLSEMIKEVNATQLAPEEILSDHPYIYSRDTDVIEIA